jgi:hypothetical protein
MLLAVLSRQYASACSGYEPLARQIAHHLVQQVGAALAHASAEAHHRVAVDAKHALGGANRAALNEGADDSELLGAGKDVSHVITV